MQTPRPPDPESRRLRQDRHREKNWKRWGPYLPERQWGTVREDYSADGSCWEHFGHDQARSRAYRWGEDGLLGICDRECRLCFALALWNEQDPFLKERLFGLTNREGNHGEDCKELYYYLDATPTHSYLKALYKYPLAPFPYTELRQRNASQGSTKSEYEILDTGVFDRKGYADVQAEYAKASPNDILIRLTLTNCGDTSATLHVLPTLWFRNTWIWGCEHEGCTLKPSIRQFAPDTLETDHQTLGTFRFQTDGQPPFMFTENESNSVRLWGTPSYTGHFKDAFHEAVVNGRGNAVNPARIGTKAAAHYTLTLEPGQTTVIRCRLYSLDEAPQAAFGPQFDAVLLRRQQEADAYYRNISPASLSPDEQAVQRQAYAGLLWSQQFYHYSVKDWLQGDPDIAVPPPDRLHGRNANWPLLFNRDIVSMPDKWEYPWYAAWDLAFHMIAYAKLDPDFAKAQLILMLREWYMHPNGQIPAYEFALGDVNPPVHAWACWRVYKISAPKGQRDLAFLARAFHKLLINFTWWVNRKDPEGRNLFAGGFLGLDNIGVFDRSKPLPGGGRLAQADGTAWMAFYCGTMLAIALELASHDPTYEDVASKFFEHFVAIADAMNSFGGNGLWDEQEGFYYDELETDGTTLPLRIRSMVGLIPIFAVEVLSDCQLDHLPGFQKRMNWFLTHRRDLASCIAYMECDQTDCGKHLLAIPCRPRLERVLKVVLDENEFLSPFGIRSLSKRHEQHPFVFPMNDTDNNVIRYLPGESDSGLFGGNSNWRGPVWFPVNYLLIEALEKYHYYYGDDFKIEYPTGSGHVKNLAEVADDLARRLVRLFLPDPHGRRPCHGPETRYADDPHFRDLLLFHEYFHAETGQGLGASHQTGWTALVAKLIQDLSRRQQTTAPC